MLDIDGFLIEARTFADQANEIDEMNAAFLDAHRGAKSMLQFVRDRIEAEKKTDEARKAELQKKLAEPGKPEPVRRMLQSELDQLEAKVYCATEKETASFDHEISDAELMLDEIHVAIKNLQNYYSKMKTEAEKLYKSMVCSSPAFSGESWIRGIDKDFSWLRRK